MCAGRIDSNYSLVILLGIASTAQIHLAKALQCQGIEALDQVRARLGGNSEPAKGGARKPLIYTLGVALNQTEFVYALVAQGYGPPALYTWILIPFHQVDTLKQAVLRHGALVCAGAIPPETSHRLSIALPMGRATEDQVTCHDGYLGASSIVRNIPESVREAWRWLMAFAYPFVKSGKLLCYKKQLMYNEATG